MNAAPQTQTQTQTQKAREAFSGFILDLPVIGQRDADLQRNVLVTKDAKQAQRRFTGEPITAWGSL